MPYAQRKLDDAALAEEFRRVVAGVHARLLRVDEAASRQRRQEGAWSRREILGHLLDSAVNNHLRFARAAIEGHYEGPSYAQREWVELHRYHDCAWSELVAWWLAANQRLGRLVAGLPAAALAAPCAVAGDLSAPLGALIADYLGHIEHHVAQIEA